MVTGIHIKWKSDDNEGGNWTVEESPLPATFMANEIFMEMRAGHEPLLVGDVFQAEEKLMLNIDLYIGFRDIETWTDFVCEAPRVVGQEVARLRLQWNMRKRTMLAAMKCVIETSMCAERPPWAMALWCMCNRTCCVLLLKFGGEVGGEMGLRTVTGNELNEVMGH